MTFGGVALSLNSNIPRKSTNNLSLYFFEDETHIELW
jgi:hypothetical protein